MTYPMFDQEPGVCRRCSAPMMKTTRVQKYCITCQPIAMLRRNRRYKARQRMAKLREERISA